MRMTRRHVCFLALVLLVLQPTTATLTYRMDQRCGETLLVRKQFAVRVTFILDALTPSRFAEGSCLIFALASRFEKLQLLITDSSIPECSAATLEILVDGQNRSKEISSPVCGNRTESVLNNPFTTDNSVLLKMTWNTYSRPSSFSFAVVLSSFRTGRCPRTDMKCKNSRCISRRLRCNGLNPCGDFSDCPHGKFSGRPPNWFVYAVVGFGSLVIVSLCCGCCKEKGGDMLFCVSECVQLLVCQVVSGFRYVRDRGRWIWMKLRRGAVLLRKTLRHSTTTARDGGYGATQRTKTCPSNPFVAKQHPSKPLKEVPNRGLLTMDSLSSGRAHTTDPYMDYISDCLATRQRSPSSNQSEDSSDSDPSYASDASVPDEKPPYAGLLSYDPSENDSIGQIRPHCEAGDTCETDTPLATQQPAQSLDLTRPLQLQDAIGSQNDACHLRSDEDTGDCYGHMRPVITVTHVI